MRDRENSSVDAIPVFLRIYRWLTLLLAFLSILFTKDKSVYLISPYLLFFLVVAYTMFVDFFRNSLYKRIHYYSSFLLIDVLICAGLIIISSYFNGSWASDYFLYSISPVMLGAYLFKLKGGLITASIFSLMDFILYFSPKGLIYHPVVPSKMSYLIADIVSYYLAGLFLVVPVIILDNLNEKLISINDVKNELVKTNENLEKINNQLFVFQQAGTIVQARTNIEDILMSVSEIMIKKFGFGETVIGLLDEKEEVFKKWINVKNFSDDITEKTKQFVKEKISSYGKKSIVSRAVKEKRIFRTEDIFQDERIDEEKIKIETTETYIALPLIVLGKRVGVIITEDLSEKKQVLSNDADILMALANQAATAIYCLRLYADKESEMEKLSAVYNVSLAIVSKKEITESLDMVVNYIKNFTQAEEVILGFAGEEAGSYEIDFNSLIVNSAQDQYHKLLQKETIKNVIQSSLIKNEFIIISINKAGDILSESLTPETENNFIQAGFFPFNTRSARKGFLVVISSFSGCCSEINLSIIKILISQIDVMFESAELNCQIQEIAISNERSLVNQAVHKGIVDSLFDVILELERDNKKVLSDPESVFKSFINIEQTAKKSLIDLRNIIFGLREDL